MIAFLGEWLYAIWEVLALSGPWLLVGFVFAGVIQVALPQRLVYRHLGKDDWRSVLTAAVAGIPIPLCSCSVLPTAISLRKSGASKGATTSFLISTPETGVDSIGITWALMDPVMTIVRPLAALVTALGSGSLVNLLVKTGLVAERPADEEQALVDESAAHAHDHDHAHHDHGHDHDHAHHGHGHDHGHDHDHTHDAGGSGHVAVRALRYAFGPLLDDLTPWFVFGIVLSGLITVLVPDDFFAASWSSGWIASLAMLAIGVPMYVCATASTPIAAALVAKGLDPGAALVFLLVGPATNIATIAVVRGFLGGRVLAAYLAGIAVISLACGMALESLYSTLGLDAVARMGKTAEEGLGPVDVAGALVMLALLVVSARRLGLASRWGQAASRNLARVGIETTAWSTRALAVVALLLLALSATIDVVRPGETGFLTRFGRVVREQHEPGLVMHLPYPIERFETVRTDEVRGVSVGLGSSASRLDVVARWTAGRLEVVTGDETLLQVPYAVHYTIDDAYRHRFGVADAERVVIAFSSSALLRAASRLTTEAALVGERRTLEEDVARMLDEELHAVDVGVRVVGVRIGGIHPPDSIHEAFRDVASALEEKERYEHDAQAHRVKALTEARGTAAELIEAAQASAVAVTSDSRGRSDAFLSLLAAHGEDPESTLLQLRLEALQRGLEGATLVFKLSDDVDVVNLPPYASDDAR